MKFAYIGQPGGDPSPHHEIKMFGYTFPYGVPVEVTDPHALTKLPGNTHFRRVEDDPVDANGSPVEIEVSIPAGEGEVIAPKKRGRKPK